MSENKDDEGIHFDPTAEELIETYLLPKVRGEPCEDNFIEMMDVYSKEPWLLDHTNDPFFKKNQWYYFVTRTQVSEKKIGCGKNTKRKITGDNNDGIYRGSWTATKKRNIIDETTGEIIGVKQSLTFSKSDQKSKKKQKRGDNTCPTVPGSESSWIMKEFTLPSKGDEFQNIALCRIEERKNSNNDLPCYFEHQRINNHESSYSEQQPINDHDEYVLASYSEYQPINDHDEYVLPCYFEHQRINNHESSYSEQQPINDHEYVLPSYSEHQPINNDHEYVLPCYFEHQAINNHESEYQPIHNDHEFVLASYSEYQPVNDHDEYVLPSFLERTREHETVGSEEDNQVHINAPLACLGHNSSLVTGSEQEAAGETEDWLQEFVNSLLTPNGSDVPAVEEDQDWLLDVPLSFHQETEESERFRF